MNIRKYYLLTSCNLEDPNPGDTYIGEGIAEMIKEYEKENYCVPVFSYVNIFDISREKWLQMAEDAHCIVVCGTPQLTADYNPPHFNDEFFSLLKEIKEYRGCALANLSIGFTSNSLVDGAELTIDRIVALQGDFIKRNYAIFDMVTARDYITAKVLERLGFGKAEELYYLDSVAFIDRQYSSQKTANLVFLKNHGALNERMLEVIAEVKEKYFDATLPTLYIASTTSDFEYYKDKVPNIICPACCDMNYFWGIAHRVISFRIHESIAAAGVYGVEVVNYILDGRSSGVELMGIHVSHLSNTDVIFQDVSGDLQIKCDRALGAFIDTFRDKCGSVIGNNLMRFSTQYCGADYWKKNGNSTYSSAIVELPIVKEFATKIASNYKETTRLEDALANKDPEIGIELGCAGGYFTNLMNDTFDIYFEGYDLSEHAVLEGNKHYKTNYLNTLSITDIDKLDRSKYTIVYSQQVIEHVPPELVDKMLAGLNKICKTKAKLYLFWVVGFEGQVAKADNDNDKTHWNLKPRHWWVNKFEKYGFKVIEHVYEPTHGMILEKIKNA